MTLDKYNILTTLPNNNDSIEQILEQYQIDKSSLLNEFMTYQKHDQIFLGRDTILSNLFCQQYLDIAKYLIDKFSITANDIHNSNINIRYVFDRCYSNKDFETISYLSKLI